MKLSGLHLLLSYQCTFECNHCFVWGSPWQDGTMTLDDIRQIIQQAIQAKSIQWIYFEGGEPFLYYGALVKGVEMASSAGFQVGIVTNSYWATSLEDATNWLRPLAPWIQDLSISSDLYHYDQKLSQKAKNANDAAEALGIPVGMISVAQPENEAGGAHGQLPTGESAVMFRGRAAVKLVERVTLHPWESFQECPFEDLRDPGRVHLDPPGNLHICQGISIGNIFQTPLSEICTTYNPETNPIISALMAGGPAELVRRYQLSPADGYADACHLCYSARNMLRTRFPNHLLPDQMYGIYNQ
jgi:Radical SAM superfamily/4Fe-4S single cluster domain